MNKAHSKNNLGYKIKMQVIKLIKQILLEGFNKSITNSARIKGERVLKNDLLRDLNVSVDKDNIKIRSSCSF